MFGHVLRHLSAYLDGQLTPAKAAKVRAHLQQCDRCRERFEAVRWGAELASSLPPRVVVPDSLWSGVVRRLADERKVRARGLVRGNSTLPLAGALSLLLAVAFAAGLLLWRGTTAVSATEVLGRSDVELARLQRPGELLFRRWRVTQVTTERGVPPVTRQWLEESWIDNANATPSGAVLRTTTLDGRLLSLHSSVIEGTTTRPFAYYTPEYPGELAGLQILAYTAEERRASIAQLPPADRANVEAYFAAPTRPATEPLLVWEHRSNRALLEAPSARRPGAPRTILSLDSTELPDGTPVYCVRDLAWDVPRLEWGANFTPLWLLARSETGRFISKANYLTVKSESDVDVEDGSRVMTTRVLEQIRSEKRFAQGFDPFAFSVPEGTTLRRFGAKEFVTGFAGVLRRAGARGTD